MKPHQATRQRLNFNRFITTALLLLVVTPSIGISRSGPSNPHARYSLPIDTLKRDRTFDITTWNLEWFGWPDSSRGPVDKTRQHNGIRRAMDSMGSDLYALQEVVSEDSLENLSSELSGNYGAIVTTDIWSDLKLGFIYNRDAIARISDGLAVNGGDDAWVNGRFPYRYTFNATVDGKTLRLVVFNIHAKATDSATALQDYERRKADAETFHAYLNQFYSHSRVLVVGDFNDDVTVAVNDSALASPYSIFRNDSASWTCATCPLAEQGRYTYLRSKTPHFIDNIIVADEIAPLLYDTYVERPQAYLPSFATTVSDHAPVTTRLVLSGAVEVAEVDPTAAVEPDGAVHVRLSENPMRASGTVELTLHEAAHVTVQLVDLIGNVSQTLLSGVHGPEIRLLTISWDSMSSGCYTLQVITNKSISNTPLILVK